MVNRPLVHRSQGVRPQYQRLHGTEVVIAVSQTVPSGHLAAPCHIYAFDLCRLWLFISPVLVGLIWTTINLHEPYNTGSLIDSHICGTCHMATEMASYILYECVALAEFRFCCQNNAVHCSIMKITQLRYRLEVKNIIHDSMQQSSATFTSA
jgi:hypothetical protein